MNFTLEEMQEHYGKELGTELHTYYKETEELFNEFFKQRQLELLEAMHDNEPSPMGIRQILGLRAKHIEEQSNIGGRQ